VKLPFEHGLNPGDTISNPELTDVFKCSPQGGMRRSRRTNTLVIVSDHTRGIYEDRWIDDILHYTGMGLEGDQKIDATQNKTLAELQSNGVEVYLFEVFEAGNYIFRGQIELADVPYEEEQSDINGNLRKVWIFPLQIIDVRKSVPLPESIIQKKQEKKEKEARRLSDDELKERLKYAKKQASKREVSSATYERNLYVAEFIKRRANGKCQLCEEPAPFNDKQGEPFLEAHHIIWLSEGGENTIENATALCPNCHRKMHVLNRKDDIEKLKLKSAEIVF
jgi:5-methylcytosine-specific restriction protein A